ncbi:MAG: hypothetical protein KDH97_19250, partial [Calditrichaeota bacterium]|nr:hypothetical protein [Calditrichota bacterium]
VRCRKTIPATPAALSEVQTFSSSHLTVVAVQVRFKLKHFRALIQGRKGISTGILLKVATMWREALSARD